MKAKRFLAILVSVLMVLTLFPAAALADTETPPTINFPAVGGTFLASDGVAWRVLHADSAGNHLIITEHVHQWAVHSPTSGWRPLADSNLRTTLDNWILAPELAANALTPVGADTDVRSAPGNFSRSENTPAGRTSPGAPIPAATAATGLFLLSISEVNEYFSHPLARIAFTAPLAPGALIQTTHWWLRSPGNPGTQSQATIVHLLDGEVSPWIHHSMTHGVRPALWVSDGTISLPPCCNPDCICDPCECEPGDCCCDPIDCGNPNCTCDPCTCEPGDCCCDPIDCGNPNCTCDPCECEPGDCCDPPCDCPVCSCTDCTCNDPPICNCPGTGCDCADCNCTDCDCDDIPCDCNANCDCADCNCTDCDCGTPCDCNANCDCVDCNCTDCDCDVAQVLFFWNYDVADDKDELFYENTVRLGTTLTVPTAGAPVREGYIFSGWYLEPANETAKGFDTYVTEALLCDDEGHLRLYASWSPAEQLHRWFMQGTDTGVFVPQGIITRGEVAAILVRTFAPASSPASPPITVFTDVAGHWASGYIAWAYFHGFILGDPPDASGNRTFRPTEPVLREELAAMVARAAELDLTDTGVPNFSDACQTTEWARPYLYAVVNEGWLRGDGNSLLRPTDDIERAEAAAVIARALGRYGSINTANLIDVADDIRLFPDVNPAAWYFYLIIEVSHSHYFLTETVVNGETSREMERWTEIIWPT